MSEGSKVPSSQELGKYKKQELVAFLKARCLPSTGNKEHLLKLARLYANRPEVISDPEVTFKDSNLLPSDTVKEWYGVISGGKKAPIPSGFTLETITTYLSVQSSVLSFNNEDEDEIVDTGTLKPVVKGRRLYQSNFVRMCEYGISSRKNLVFRANIWASMKQDELRYPRVVISQKGSILEGSCTCPAKNDGRCTHIAALLYCVEDLSFGNTPKVPIPGTSQPQAWGRGRKRGNEPGVSHEKQYSKKHKVRRYHDFEPRTIAKKADPEVLLRGVQSLHRDSMWSKILRFHYTDYVVSQERRDILRELRNQYESNLAVSDDHIDPVHSTSFGSHIAGTIEQAKSQLWFQMRRGRITASWIKDVIDNPRKVAENMWKKQPNLDNVKSVAWGRENESLAREAYSQVHNKQVTEVGLYISTIRPMIGASPGNVILNLKSLISSNHDSLSSCAHH